MALTYLNIEPELGNAALLPNQPIIQGCKVVGETLVPGDTVTLVGNMEVMKADIDDAFAGVVVGNCIKTGFQDGEFVSIFPLGAFVYMKAGATDFEAGDEVGINEYGEVVLSTGNSLGVAWTEADEAGELVIIQIKPSSVAGLQSRVEELETSVEGLQPRVETLETAIDTKLDKFSIGDGLQLTDVIMYGWTGDIEGYPTLYTKVATPEATGVLVYAFENGVFEKFVDDATYADDSITITLAGQSYTYDVGTTKDTQGQFLSAISE